MLQILIRLTPDQENISEEAKKIVYENTLTAKELEKLGLGLIEDVEKISNNLAK